MLESSPELLGMPDIETLCILIINYETIGRQMTPDNNPDKRKRNAKGKETVKTKGWKPWELYEQMADVQKECNVDNTPAPSVTPKSNGHG